MALLLSVTNRVDSWTGRDDWLTREDRTVIYYGVSVKRCDNGESMPNRPLEWDVFVDGNVHSTHTTRSLARVCARELRAGRYVRDLARSLTALQREGINEILTGEAPHSFNAAKASVCNGVPALARHDHRGFELTALGQSVARALEEAVRAG